MESTSLRAAYANFHDTAASGPFRAPAQPGKWSAELIVAHIVAIDHLLAASISELLAGRAPTHDNRPGIRESHLRAIAAAAEDWPGLLATARQSAAVVYALADEVPPDAAARPFPMLLQSGEAVVFDGAITLSQLLDAQTRLHLPGHVQQIRALKA